MSGFDVLAFDNDVAVGILKDELCGRTERLDGIFGIGNAGDLDTDGIRADLGNGGFVLIHAVETFTHDIDGLFDGFIHVYVGALFGDCLKRDGRTAHKVESFADGVLFKHARKCRTANAEQSDQNDKGNAQ